MMKKLLAILFALLLVFGMAACAAEPAETTGATETSAVPTENGDVANEENYLEEGLMEFTLIVVHKDGATKEFRFQTADKYVGMVLKAEGLIKGNDGPYGLEITEVDGESAVYERDKAYWALYEGEEYALQGIDTTEVAHGAIYKLVYTVG